ncbi:MAG: hypothetical protein D6734_05250 [Candidatus Schekmanbacteria bacterium]|nr:MAG: hypothetical protein D6734_05250 [Candidatus Schekmanbacteria bacterium]
MFPKKNHSLTFIFFFLLSGIFCFLLSQAALAEKSELESLLPSAMLKKGFTSPYEYAVYDDTDLFEYIDGGAPFYIERGFEELISNEYKKGDDSFIVDIYKMESVESAAKLFKDIKKKNSKKTDFGEDGQLGSNQAEFYRSKYFVRITAFKTDEKTIALVKEFAKAVDENILKLSRGK